MRFLVYVVVLLIAAGSVLSGLDWLSSPMSPMPPIKPVPVQTARAPAVPVQPPTPAPVPVRTVTAPAAPVAALQAPPAAVAPAPVLPPPLPAAEPVAAAATTAIAVDEKPQPKCDVNACTAAYRSFTASDCTYQPSFGPRRLCTKGVAANDAPDPPAVARAEVKPPAQCNVSACSSAYVSFTAADCTYQPVNGPRRLCEK